MSNELTFKPTQVQVDTLKNLGMEENQRREFIGNLGTLILNNPNIAELDRNSVFNVALMMSKLNINQETSTGYMVPYNDKKRGIKVAQLQIGYKGYVELAMRTGLYTKIDCVEVKESDYVDFNIDTNTYTWREGKLSFQEVLDRKKEPTIGYRAFAITHSGDKLEMFMTMEEIDAHHTKYSQAFKYKDKFGNIFNTSKDAMDRKVVLKLFINRNLVKSMNPNQSNDLLKALKYDSSVIDKDNKPHYIDNPNDAANKRLKQVSKEVLEDGTTIIQKQNQLGKEVVIEVGENSSSIEAFNGVGAETKKTTTIVDGVEVNTLEEISFPNLDVEGQEY